MFIKFCIGKSIRDSNTNCAKVREYLKAIDEQFETSDKTLANTMMTNIYSMKFNGTKEMREHIIEMRDITAQLKSLEIEISESFLIHFILNSFLFEHGPFKISCNTHKKE